MEEIQTFYKKIKSNEFLDLFKEAYYSYDQKTATLTINSPTNAKNDLEKLTHFISQSFLEKKVFHKLFGKNLKIKTTTF